MVKDKRVVTEDLVVLFTDVHNFSLAMNAMQEHVSTFLQCMYGRLGDIIVDHSGEIVKYIGDGLLCVFPAGCEITAVRCGMELREAFSGLAKSWLLPPDTELETGIDAGSLAVGVFGHPTLMQRDVFGVAVNQAATIGHHRGIAITERVHDKVKSSFQIRQLPDLKLKWRVEPLKVWEVVGRA